MVGISHQTRVPLRAQSIHWRPLLRWGALILILFVGLLHLNILLGDKYQETAGNEIDKYQKFGDSVVNRIRNISLPTLTREAENDNNLGPVDDVGTEGEVNKIRQSSIQTTTDGSSWTESHSPRNESALNNKDVRISFRLHDPNDVPTPRKFLSVHGYTCNPLLHKFGPPHASFVYDRNVLNFTTTISTDLNILFVGDSISQQFAQGFYASVLGEEYVGSHDVTNSFINGKDIKTSNSGLHVCSSIVAPSRGGGASAYWRVLGLMSKSTEALSYVNCKREMGWLAQDGKRLSRHRYIYPPSGDGEGNILVKKEGAKHNGATTFYKSNVTYDLTQQQLPRIGGFDCCVLRIPHGWMKLHEITRERIIEEIELCSTVVGAKTVIVSTLSLNNNVLTPTDWDRIIEINEIVRDIARSWNASLPEDGGVQWVMVQEFGNFTNQILWRNAQHIGYNITIPDFTKNDGWEKQGSEFLLHRYQHIKSMKLAPSIPMVCAYHIEQPFSTKNETAGDCFFNRISRDGMHWCVETVGSRYSACIACLLGCVYNGEGSRSIAEVRSCEQECNDRFMSLVPVDEGWIGADTTIFSKPNK